MYRHLSVKTVNCFLAKGVIPEGQRDVYEYSFEVLYSDLMYFILLGGTALLFRCGWQTVLFLLGFIPLRRLAGGYHASTYLKCHLLFWFTQMAMIACCYWVPERWYMPGAYALAILSCLLVFLFAPVAHENKPLSEKERKRFFILSRVAALAILVFPAAAALLHLEAQLIFTFTFGAASVAVSLMAEKAKQNFKHERSEPNG